MSKGDLTQTQRTDTVRLPVKHSKSDIMKMSALTEESFFQGNTAGEIRFRMLHY